MAVFESTGTSCSGYQRDTFEDHNEFILIIVDQAAANSDTEEVNSWRQIVLALQTGNGSCMCPTFLSPFWLVGKADNLIDRKQ